MQFASAKCSLGTVLVALGQRGLCAILLGDDAGELRRDLRARFPGDELGSVGDGLLASVDQVVAFLDEPHDCLGVPLDPRGTVFQRRVWGALQTIPAGSTTTYMELAER